MNWGIYEKLSIKLIIGEWNVNHNVKYMNIYKEEFINNKKGVAFQIHRNLEQHQWQRRRKQKEEEQGIKQQFNKQRIVG